MSTQAAERVVSLTCSNTEIVCALGCGDRLVGIDDYSDYPPEVVAGLPRVGPDLGVDVDKVAAVEPDLVLASLTVPGHEKVVAAVERAELPFVAPAPERLSDVYQDIEEIAALLGVPERGAEVVARMRAELAPVDPDPRHERPTIAVQWWPKPSILPGGRSWVTDLIDLAGGRNPIGDEAVLSRPVPDEELAALDPDAIVLSWCGVEEDKYRPSVVYENPVLATTRAVRNRAVRPITEAYLGRPSPRLIEGYRALKKLVNEFVGQRRKRDESLT